jgi:hypothetical protein
MLYRDLVEFDPIETIIKVRESSSFEQARALVRTYVISKHMADSLVGAVLPQIDLSRPHDNKGVLIVGNYGTGKSHLMSVLAAVAEFPELVDELTDDRVKEAARPIAGRFKVWRVEIGSVERGLRDILLSELEEAMETWGTPFTFPAADQVNNNKDALIDAVAAFQIKYPGQGILLVVDELLDHLLGANDQQRIRDLGFLRELGEVSSETMFRFVGGTQEALFGSPSFASVQQALTRVRDRFEQVLIAREDIAFVVSHRLLSKSEPQLARVTEHLRRFEPMYNGLAERMPEFASLFPIHPAYLEIFQDLFIAEKRQVLATFSKAMEGLLDEAVPEDQPGVISFDHYWNVIRNDTSLTSNTTVSAVIDKSRILEGLIRSNFTRKPLLPIALRIIHGLSVHRLTTDDLTAKVGLTAQALRDSLFLLVPLPEANAEFLLTQVQVALREILNTVQGQFISHVEENGQYYIDVHKDVDFQAQVEVRGSSLDPDALNRSFNAALQQTLGLSSSTYVPDFKIWAYELPWDGHNVTRPGYLFMGLPSERSTAQPERDFYVYLLPPFRPGKWNDEEREDEVMLSLTALDDAFEQLVRRYGGAQVLAATSAEHRTEYARRAERHLTDLATWLRGNLLTHLEVRFQGVTRPAVKVLAETGDTGADTVREVLDAVAAHCLTPTFEERYPDYPRFSRVTARITEAARENTALNAIRVIGGLRSTALAEAVLGGLGLRNAEGALRPYDSPYARHLLGLLTAKGEGQVVNRSEVIHTVAGGIDRPVEKDARYNLEPDWVAVVMATLIYSGDIEVNYGARRVGAGEVDRLASMPMSELIAFRNYGAPPAPPIGRWEEIFELLGLPPGDIRAETQRAQAVKALQAAVHSELERAVRLEARVTEGLRVWNTSLFTEQAVIHSQDGVVVGSEKPVDPWTSLEVLPHVRAYKALLTALQSYDSEGKLRNLRIAPEMVSDARAGRAVVARLEGLLGVLGSLQERAAYLAQAEAHLPAADPLVGELHATRDELVAALKRMGRGQESAVPGGWPACINGLRQRYVAWYAAAHRAKVLGPAGDDRRENIYRSEALKQVQELNRLHLLPSTDLESWQDRIAGLKACREFHDGVLDNGPVCPSCHYDPRTAATMPDADAALDGLEDELGRLLADWQQAVVSALGTDVAQGSLAAMTPTEQATIQAFLTHPHAPVLPAGFAAAANKALKGIQAVTVSLRALEAALRDGGLPCTVTDFRARLNGYLQKALEGHTEENTRLTLSGGQEG